MSEGFFRRALYASYVFSSAGMFMDGYLKVFVKGKAMF